MTDAPTAAAQAPFRFTERLRVRWAEVDLQQIVFNGHYLMYLDTAMAGYWRALALPYHDTMAAFGGDLYVRKATVEYHGSARYDDQLRIGLRCQRLGNTSILFGGAVMRDARRLVDGELVYVYADPTTQQSRPVPAALREILQAFEAGEAMTRVELLDWPAARSAAQPLREAVFGREQGIDTALLCDAADDGAVHAVVRNRLGAVVGAGRLLAAADGVGTLGRMATHGALRGAGIGRALVDALAGAAAARGDRSLRLHAQSGAVDFYRRLGFEPVGPAFVEAGLPHQTMVRAVSAASTR